jgi:hypothetical protein
VDLRIGKPDVLGGMLLKTEVKKGGRIRIIEHTKEATEKDGEENNAKATQNTL